MRIDLHTHSLVSDGTDTPGEVVRAAKRAGLDVVALTDHDTAVGWAEAAEVARDEDITLVPGMEISTRHRERGVHLLAYLPDPTYPPLVAALDEVLEGRNARVPAICARLAEHGFPVTEEDVRRLAGRTAATGRPHVADALVQAGHVADRSEAFRRFLSPGMPGYVRRHAADLVEMLGLVTAAGGVSVIAHPWGRHDPAGLGEEELAELTRAGLAGLEVDHRDHGDADRDRLRGIARTLGLVATGSSDYHGLGKVDHGLGIHTTAPEEYERLLALAADAAARSGRRAPEPVG